MGISDEASESIEGSLSLSEKKLKGKSEIFKKAIKKDPRGTLSSKKLTRPGSSTSMIELTKLNGFLETFD